MTENIILVIRGKAEPRRKNNAPPFERSPPRILNPKDEALVTLPRLSLTRRQALTGLAVSGAATFAATSDVQGGTNAAAQNANIATARACILTPQSVEGPYYFDPRLIRADVTEGRDGVPLRLLLQMIDAGKCLPLKGARIDIWHADARGVYSGYEGQGDNRALSTKGQTFLRGTQMTDAAGEVAFRTIYPGWYRGRTAHIHFKIFLDSRNVAMGQIFFPDALSEFIYENVSPYTDRDGERDTSNATDGVLRMSGGGYSSFCSIKEEGDHYLASLVIGIDRNGKVATGGPRRGDMPPNGAPLGPPPGGPGGGAGGPPPDGGMRSDLGPPPGSGPGGTRSPLDRAPLDRAPLDKSSLVPHILK